MADLLWSRVALLALALTAAHSALEAQEAAPSSSEATTPIHAPRSRGAHPRDPLEDRAAPTLQPPKADALGQQRIQRLSLWFENDAFAAVDRHYTNGAKLAWQVFCPEFLEPFTADVDIPGLRGRAQDLSVWIGQNMYSPENLDEELLIPDDRPYGGWLYLGVGMTRTNLSIDFEENLECQPDALAREVLYQEFIALELGLVGNSSGADKTQIEIHRLTNSDPPEGWRNQLKSEIGFQFKYACKWLLPLWPGKAAEEARWQVDVLPHAVLEAGTIYGHVGGGGTLRVGWNTHRHFGPTQRIGGGLDLLGALDAGRWQSAFRCYGFARLETRVVWRNIFVDGNTFRSPVERLSVNGIVERVSIDREPVVADAEFGFVFELPWVQLSYATVVRTKEFETQEGLTRFGAVQLSVALDW